MPPWLKMCYTGAEVAGTQYTVLINVFRFLNCSLKIKVLQGDIVADSTYDCSVPLQSSNFSILKEVKFTKLQSLLLT